MNMTPEQLVIWIHGMLEYRHIGEIAGEEALEMLQGIKDHVALQFKKVTPPVKPKEEKKDSLDDILKRHVIKPVYPQQPYAPFPGTPLPYSPKDKFWLDSPGTGGPMTVTC